MPPRLSPSGLARMRQIDPICTDVLYLISRLRFLHFTVNQHIRPPIEFHPVREMTLEGRPPRGLGLVLTPGRSWNLPGRDMDPTSGRGSSQPEFVSKQTGILFLR